MPRSMQECHDLGMHRNHPRRRCPDCPPVPDNEDQSARTDSSFEPPLTLTIGKREFKVWDLADASRLYQEERDMAGQGSSTFPEGKVTGGGEQNYRISYNGRVWKDEPWKPGDQPAMEAVHELEVPHTYNEHQREWHCLWCHAPLREGENCRKPECVEQTRRSERRMGISRPTNK